MPDALHLIIIGFALSDPQVLLTLVMLNHITNTSKGDSWRDVIAPIVQTSNFVVLDNIAVHRVVISDREGEASWEGKTQGKIMLVY